MENNNNNIESPIDDINVMDEDEDRDHPRAGDIVIERLTDEDAEMFEDEFDIDIAEDTSKIQLSEAIDKLPDISIRTANDAADSNCCLDVRKVSENRILIAVGSCDEKCRLYVYIPSIQQLSLLQILSEYTDSVVDVAYSYDGKYLAAASYDSTVKVYSIAYEFLEQSQLPQNITPDVPIATLVQTLEGPSIDIEWIKWHPKGYAVIAGSKDSTAWMWWAPNGNMMNVFSGHGAPVSCGTFALGGKVIATGSVDGSLIVWNPKTTEKFFSFGQSSRSQKQCQDSGMTGAHFHTEPITCICAHPTLPLVATGSEDSTVRLTNIETGKLIGVLNSHTDSVESLAFLDTPDPTTNSTLLASGSLDGSIFVWDCSRLTAKVSFKHLEVCESEKTEEKLVGGVTKLRWVEGPDAPLLVSASTDCTLRVWDVRDGRCLHILSGHRDTILDVQAFRHSADNHSILLASCSDDQSLKIWEV